MTKLKKGLTIIEKHFKRKPTEKQINKFIAELIVSNKGFYKTEVIYDKENFPNYLQFRIYDEKIS
tara:strand:- start:75 stop:269 length:195 start_codon:yes stop_codon:yes gene_type:complete